ncbi:MAG: hypothetical protein LBQ84_01430 [Flavobacteriaceae bacterium]|jgi:hypothetical protein|nr:hypothetical protein [Flavobacteriaceae bacterium]
MAIYKARESTDIIERLYITMRHLFNRGGFKPTGTSGLELRNYLLKLNPEIYGSITDSDKVELNGLIYVLDRLPQGIEECSFIFMTSNEGLDKSSFTPIYPKKRRRTCYRVDEHQMNIEVLLGRSEIYDILTHLTFLYNEADKIRKRSHDFNGKAGRIWTYVEKAARSTEPLKRKEREVILAHISTVLGRSFDEVIAAYKNFQETNDPDRFIRIIYNLGKVSKDDFAGIRRREIFFSSILKERVGHHLFGDKWAETVKRTLAKHKLLDKKIHIISSNMHSVKNMLYAFDALNKKYTLSEELKTYEELSKDLDLVEIVKNYAQKNGMIEIKDTSGSNIDVQIFDLSKINLENTTFKNSKTLNREDVLVVFDYAFGEQAFEIMDELLRPYTTPKQRTNLNVDSISILGKAGILSGNKGDIMIPNAHIFEGTADNYPFHNELSLEDFEGYKVNAYKGAMITVLGTSLQNKDVLTYFMETSWRAIGLEMEGAHYQKAIQVASKIRHHIIENVKLRYAYYASDNPLETGSTLASGGLGLTGVKPTYLITQKILEQILNNKN